MNNLKINITTTHLKLIAFVSMVIDHIGYIIFPDILILRYIGRLAFPIYAFLIGEGCIYSKNKKKYLLKTTITLFIFQIIFFLIHNTFYISVLYGFTCAILSAIIWEWAQKDLNNRRPIAIIPIILLFFSILIINSDYTFFAMILPLIVFFVKNKTLQKLLFGIMLILMSFCYGKYQILCIFSMIPILLYNGKKGKEIFFKNSFYVFYPLHYLIIGLINMFIK